MTIKQWNQDERPQEKFSLRGAQALSDAELIALLIRTGTASVSAVDLARQLLTVFGSLRGLMAAEQSALCSHHGVGMVKASKLRATAELAQRLLKERIVRTNPFESAKELDHFLALRLRDSRREIFGCIWLDTRHQIIDFESLFEGTLSGAAVPIREVVIRGLECNAAAVIAVHNHPSGVAKPSSADIVLTSRLQEALALVEIELLDHLIVGEEGSVRLSSLGLLGGPRLG